MAIQNKNHLPLLTSLRGVAALLVVIYHAKHQFPVLFDQVAKYTHIFKQGYLWVDFFFILSGFILSYVYGKRFLGGLKKKDYSRFLVARLARIYPLHFVMLMVYLFMELSKYWMGFNHLENPIFNPENRSGLQFVSSLWLVQSANLHETAVWNAPAWSISAEWFAYLLFPLAAAKVLRASPRSAIILFATSIAALGALIAWHGDLNIFYDLAVPRSWLGCLMGMCLYRICQTHTLNCLNSGKITWLTLLFCCAIMSLPRWWGYELLAILSLAMLVLVASKCSGKIFLLNSKPMMYLGEISYSIYLTHGFLLIMLYNFIHKGLGYAQGGASMGLLESLLWCIGVLIISVVISGITYRLIELKGKALIIRKTRHWFAHDSSPIPSDTKKSSQAA